MTKKQLNLLARRLAPELLGSQVNGAMITFLPIRDILRAVAFEGSAFDKISFYATAFFLPLFIPTRHIHFTFGQRVRQAEGGDRWDARSLSLVPDISAALRNQAVPLLDKINDARAVIEIITSTTGTPNLYVSEALAYCLARVGDTGKAIVVLTQLVDNVDANVSWQHDVAERAQVLRSKLLRDPAEAQIQLEMWKEDTMRWLNL